MPRRCARSPQRTAAALQVQQSPWSLACPTDHAEPVDVVVERIALALAQRENSTVGSPKNAVSPRPPRRNSGAARTAPFSETRAAARSFIRTAPTVHCRGRLSDPGLATHVRPGLRFVQCFASCSCWSRSPSRPSLSPRRPARSLPARALQLAPSFLRDEAGYTRRSRACMRRLHWSKPSWVCFAPSAVTRPT